VETSLLYIASVVCLFIGLLSAISVISTNTTAWFIGGVLAYVLAAGYGAYRTVRRPVS
jgi:hypothetical protein